VKVQTGGEAQPLQIREVPTGQPKPHADLVTHGIPAPLFEPGLLPQRYSHRLTDGLCCTWTSP